MSSKWHEKKEKQAREQFERDLQNQPEYAEKVKDATAAVAMGGGDEQVFEKKMTKEEKKAAKKAAREAKRKAKKGDEDDDKQGKGGTVDIAKAVASTKEVIAEADNPLANDYDDGIDHEQADQLASEGTICTFATSKKGVDSRSRDINVQNFTLQHMGEVMLDETEIVLNHGNRYGLIGR